jgi:predicted RNase H-like nuclease
VAQPPRLKRGAPVPYRLLAGVEPCGRGWLVVSGKLQGVSLFPEPPQLLGTLIEILDYRPSFEIVALHAPIGLPSALHPGGRASDRAARRLLGPRRGSAIVSPPSRSVLDDDDGTGLSAVVRTLLPRIRRSSATSLPTTSGPSSSRGRRRASSQVDRSPSQLVPP